MIKNQKQAGITKEKLEELKRAKTDFENRKNEMEASKYQLGVDSFEALIKDLEEQLSFYNSLVEGNFNYRYSNSLDDIPNVLIAARLAQNLSQEELGELLKIKGQQIQRYEATNYETSSWVRMVEMAIALQLEAHISWRLRKNSENKILFAFPTNTTQEQAINAQQKIKNSGNLLCPSIN